MQSYHGRGTIGSTVLEAVAGRIGVAVEDLARSIKEGLLAVSVTVGLEILRQMMEEEVNQVAGVKGKHNKGRRASRHGFELGSVVLGGRKVRIKRPRVRTTDGREVRLETYQAFRDAELLTLAALEKMLHGLSTRRYPYGLEPVGEGLLDERSIARSSISRRFVEATCKALAQLMSKPLGGLQLVVLFIDGIEVASHTVVVAMGVDCGGRKHLLGLWEGATENGTVCKALLSDLVERGLRAEDGLLVVIDGSRALRAAVRDVLGCCAVVQRCQVHKKRNVLEHLPENARGWVGRKLDQAYGSADYDRALSDLRALAGVLEKDYPGAAASLREGLEETLTVVKLGLPQMLGRSVRSTNVIESTFDAARTAMRNVKRWQSGEQVLRWTAAALREAEARFHRIPGYRDLPLLVQALQKEVHPINSSEVKTA